MRRGMSCQCRFKISGDLQNRIHDMSSNEAVMYLTSLSKEMTVKYIHCKKEGNSQLYQTFRAESPQQAAEKIHAYASDGKPFPPTKQE